MKPKLTEKKLGEYMGMLKRGEIDLDEFRAGLIAVYGMTHVEGTMTPREFLDYLGVPLDQIEMSDELRKELEAMEGEGVK